MKCIDCGSDHQRSFTERCLPCANRRVYQNQKAKQEKVYKEIECKRCKAGFTPWTLKQLYCEVCRKGRSPAEAWINKKKVDPYWKTNTIFKF